MLLAAVTVARLAASLSAAQPEKDPGPIAHFERGIAALEAKKPEEAKKELALAAAALPNEPDVLYALAKAEALTGDSTSALKHLSRVVAMGYGADAGTDPAFAALAALPGFRALAPAIAENGKPVTRS